MKKLFILGLLTIVGINHSVYSQSYATINDSTFNTAYFINDQLIASPFLIDSDSIKTLRIVTDTLVAANNKVFKNCIFVSYPSPIDIIPLKNVKIEIQKDYSNFSHIYMINNEFVQKSAPNFLIDKNYIWKTELLPLVPSNKKQKDNKLLIIRIFTKDIKDEMEGVFHIR